MQSPEPDQPTSWIPSRKLITGGIVGQAAAQIIVAVCDQYFKTPLSPELAAAITTLCYAAAAYFIPNSQ